MRFSPVLALAACVLVAGCGGTAPDGSPANGMAAANYVPPQTQAPRPVAGQAQTVPLSAYIGHYPDEPVDGVGFFDRTEVATALDGAVTDAKLRRSIIHATVPRVPIFAAGSRIAARGCEAHDCQATRWTLLIDPTSGKGEVCMPDPADARSRWYVGGPAQIRPGGCPATAKG